PYVLCQDDSIIGTAFYVMDYVEGRVLWDQSLPGMSKSERLLAALGGAVWRRAHSSRTTHLVGAGWPALPTKPKRPILLQIAPIFRAKIHRSQEGSHADTTGLLDWSSRGRPSVYH